MLPSVFENVESLIQLSGGLNPGRMHHDQETVDWLKLHLETTMMTL